MFAGKEWVFFHFSDVNQLQPTKSTSALAPLRHAKKTVKLKMCGFDTQNIKRQFVWYSAQTFSEHSELFLPFHPTWDLQDIIISQHAKS